MTGPYRFVRSSKSGQYSVWRGDQWIGHVERVWHKLPDGRRISAGWRPSNDADFALEPSRAAAAGVLWRKRR